MKKKIKLQTHQLEAIRVLVAEETARVEAKRTQYTKDALMNADRKKRAIKDCDADVRYWQKLWRKLDTVLEDEQGNDNSNG